MNWSNKISGEGWYAVISTQVDGTMRFERWHFHKAAKDFTHPRFEKLSFRKGDMVYGVSPEDDEFPANDLLMANKEVCPIMETVYA